MNACTCKKSTDNVIACLIMIGELLSMLCCDDDDDDNNYYVNNDKIIQNQGLKEWVSKVGNLKLWVVTKYNVYVIS